MVAQLVVGESAVAKHINSILAKHRASARPGNLISTVLAGRLPSTISVGGPWISKRP
ncbi:hypothetical protein ACIBO6_04825 [Streptomyces luteogriseus]|uniref:hypothetical protein n=1 Tax=Streptomyces luteogriseus TaxID=68233 RepID=UPI0037955F90